jgi:hypothetical protein
MVSHLHNRCLALHLFTYYVLNFVSQKFLEPLCSGISFFDFHVFPAAFKDPVAALCDNELIAALPANISFSYFVSHVMFSSI